MGALCAGEIVKANGGELGQWAVTSYLRQGKPSEGGPNECGRGKQRNDKTHTVMRLCPSSFNRQAVRPSLNRLRQGRLSRLLDLFSARCFAAAEVSGPAHAVQALSPGTLGLKWPVALIRSGEVVYYPGRAGRTATP